MTTTYGPLVVWAVVGVVGVATFAIRYSFVYLFGRIDGVPPWIEEALRFVPAAVLAALVAPAVVDPGPTLAATVLDDRLLAGAVAAAVAWYTENMFATIAVGLLALWAVGAAI
ncbi:AzlD domain-containing protein [Haloplanus salinus]|uniref:AzlD domain-containing protein n=1 Tax=Haloplanus salinus TaxID=1126245 RepID=A0A368N9B7_9EURY|nr:AzlD domain-containing protein [Haloplanus salinus]RCU46836.1 AzlD domain-containing protein [Haloplanus salinus]